MFSCTSLSLAVLLVAQLGSVDGLTTSCQKNRFIDYSQLIETDCLVENCILASNCTGRSACECKRDFVVRYNVTADHEEDEDHDHDEEDEESSLVHFSVIAQPPPDDTHPEILVS